MSRPTRAEMPISHVSPLEEDLLTLLNGRELYSIQIERALKEVCDRKRRFGSLYPTLRHMEKRGLLSARWGDEPSDVRGGPRRRYYTTTELGMQALEEVAARRKGLAAWKLTT